jgi:hypothetical protein
MNTTPTCAAAQLRKLADALSTDQDMPIISVSVNISPSYSLDKTAGVATVDTVAALFGLTAEPDKTGSGWYHQARDERDGVRLWVYTPVEHPAQRCVCGARCTHTGGTR